MAAEVKGEDMLGELDGNVTRGERFHTRKCCKRLETFWSCLLFITPYGLGVIHNCHPFHERTQRTLGGRGSRATVLFFEMSFFKCRDGNKEIIAHVK